jgi:hypothetical protein
VALALFATLALVTGSARADDCPATKSISSGKFTCGVPAFAAAVLVSVTGGDGAGGSDGSAGGGPGDVVSAWYLIGPGQVVAPASVFQFAVGGDGNNGPSAGGGGDGGSGSQSNGGAGGGASSLSIAGGPLLIMAGGGGGGGGGNLDGSSDSDTVFGGGNGGGVNQGGVQASGSEYFLDYPGFHIGGSGGGSASGPNAGGGGQAYTNYGAFWTAGFPNGSSGQGSVGGTGGSGGQAGGGGGGGGYGVGGGGGGGGDNLAGVQPGDPFPPRSGAGGGGGGSDSVSGGVEQLVAQGARPVAGSRVAVQFSRLTGTTVYPSASPVSACGVATLVVGLDAPINIFEAPTGTIALTEDGRTLATVPPDTTTGRAAVNVVLTSGTHTIGATYTGDAQYPPGIAAPITQEVASCAGPTTTTVTSSDADQALCAGITLTATVIGRDPTGTVGFLLDGSQGIGAAGVGADGRASIGISTLAAGTHSIMAFYYGDHALSGDTRNAASNSAPFTQVVDAGGPQAQCTASFGAGASASVVVPTDATSMVVTAAGGRGGAGTGPRPSYYQLPAQGGAGELVTATFPVGAAGPVTPGATVSVAVGGDATGWQAPPGGGGAGGHSATQSGGAGGGATRVAIGATTLVVAGGGGGGGGGLSQQEDDINSWGAFAGRDAGEFPDGDPDAGGGGGGGATATSPGKSPAQRTYFDDVEGVHGAPGAPGSGGAGGTPRGAGGSGGGGGGGVYGGGGGDPGAPNREDPWDPDGTTGGGGGGGGSFLTAGASSDSESYASTHPSVTIQFGAPGNKAVRKARAFAAARRVPVVDRLHLSDACMVEADKHDGRPREIQLRYRLSQRATVSLQLQRSVRARNRTYCRAPAKINGPWTRSIVRRHLRAPGVHHLDIRRYHGPLPPGTYRLTITATDIYGKRTRPHTVRFSVIQ